MQVQESCQTFSGVRAGMFCNKFAEPSFGRSFDTCDALCFEDM